jgi:hypothetical protein
MVERIYAYIINGDLIGRREGRIWRVGNSLVEI